MKLLGMVLLLLVSAAPGAGQADGSRAEAEYYVDAYAQHYGIPIEFARAVVEQESNWQRCPVSNKGAAGLMQLMPETAERLGVLDRCDLKQNVSGGIRHLAWLCTRFHRDLRLVAAAYYAGEDVVAARGLRYANPDVVSYVAEIAKRVERQKRFRGARLASAPRRRSQ